MKIDTVIEKGRFIRNNNNPMDLAYYYENREAVMHAYKLFRFEWVLGRNGEPLNRTTNEWVIHGSKGQAWEYGIGKLGFTIEGSKRIESFKHANSSWANVCQNGDGEANFWCVFDSINLERVAKALKLIRRRQHKSL